MRILIAEDERDLNKILAQRLMAQQDVYKRQGKKRGADCGAGKGVK